MRILKKKNSEAVHAWTDLTGKVSGMLPTVWMSTQWLWRPITASMTAVHQHAPEWVMTTNPGGKPRHLWKEDEFKREDKDRLTTCAWPTTRVSSTVNLKDKRIGWDRSSDIDVKRPLHPPAPALFRNPRSCLWTASPSGVCLTPPAGGSQTVWREEAGEAGDTRLGHFWG